MKRNRIGLIVLTVMLCVSSAVFANWREELYIGNLYVKTITANPAEANTSITVASPVTFSGAVTLSSTLTGDVTGHLVDAGTALSVTNGQAVSLTGGIILLNGVGGADDSTNTVTVSGTIGTETTLIVASASTNLITIADSGTVYLSSAWLGDNNDVIKLYVRSATTNVVETCSIDN